MIKRILLTLICLFSFSAYATNYCPMATETNNPGFCPSFVTAATCHCTASGLPQKMCQDMNMIYSRMISIFGSLQKACEFQHDTPTQTCVDDWNCYRLGGKDSLGRLCSATGRACQ